MGKKGYFAPVDLKVDFPSLEEKILAFWESNRIFEKSVKQNSGAFPFVFFEGPPTANGQPGIHHVMARSFKDLYPRFWTMRGKYCLRKGGWDTHGLPVELEVEKALGLSGKKEIEKYGIARFNQKCRESVWKYVDLWENLTKRMGYWINLKDAYVTLKPEYIETGWWILKQLWDKGLLVKDYKVLPYCPRCGTPVSSHELALGYQDLSETSVFVKFKLVDDPAFILAWTTTPWTLPGNVALAIDQNSEYVRVLFEDQELILAKRRLEVLGDKYQVLERIRGRTLLGKKYEPLYNFIEYDQPAHFIVAGDFVSMEEGTGVVHTAVMYGADDFELGKKYGLPNRHCVDSEGKFVPEVKPWAGKFVKEADPEIVADLKKRDLLLKTEAVTHSYPHCWRCKTPLLYYAIESWFVRTTEKKEEIIRENEKINWFPEHMGKGRMGEWLANMVDWSLSRSRYWGTPLPIWHCSKCEQEICIGSFEELSKLSGKSLGRDFDPHRPDIDKITLKCPKCSSKMMRYPYVLDCWFDSGAMPYAQWHYPFENQKKFKEQFPADFIAEGQDQTRGWFYTLLVLGTLISGQSSFKNVISHNLVLDSQGKKMSKSVGNVVDPWETIKKYGADVVRWYFYSFAPMGNECLFKEEDLKTVARSLTLRLWNVYNFLITYANLDGWRPEKDQELKSSKSQNVLDQWILARFKELVGKITKSLEEYDAFLASRLIETFLEDLSNWYIRRSRDRVGLNAENQKDKNSFYQTCYFVLVNLMKVLAPLTPFIAEEIYQQLTKKESVHLTDWPKSIALTKAEEKLIQAMALVRQVVEDGHFQRKDQKIPVRQPLPEIKVFNPQERLEEPLIFLIKEELNVKAVGWGHRQEGTKVTLETKITPELKKEGQAREIIRQIQDERKKMGLALDEKVTVQLSDWPKEFESEIKKKALAAKIVKGQFKVLQSS